MSLRFRRSFKILPGVRLNLTKRGVGTTIGGPLARVSINSNGDITKSIGLPGTGLYWQDRHKIDRGQNEQPEAAEAVEAERVCPECGTAMKNSDDTCPGCGTFLGVHA
jgi:hypothetical protein